MSMRSKIIGGMALGTVFCAAAVRAAEGAAAVSASAAGAGVDSEAAMHAIGLGAAAALAVGVSALAAGHAMGRIGAAALGAAAEKPELLIRSLLFMALAEGLGVLGFAIAMLLVQKI